MQRIMIVLKTLVLALLACFLVGAILLIREARQLVVETRGILLRTEAEAQLAIKSSATMTSQVSESLELLNSVVQEQRGFYRDVAVRNKAVAKSAQVLLHDSARFVQRLDREVNSVLIPALSDVGASASKTLDVVETQVTHVGESANLFLDSGTLTWKSVDGVVHHVDETIRASAESVPSILQNIDDGTRSTAETAETINIATKPLRKRATLFAKILHWIAGRVAVRVF